jgi:hypothetical protein
VAAAEKKVEREKKKAEKAAKQECEKQEHDSRKAVQKAQLGKRKVLRSSAPKAKRVQRTGDVADGLQSDVAAPVPQLESQRAAAKSTYHANSSSTSCSILSTVYYSKRSRSNSYRGCCYSLMFGMVMMLVGGSLRESGHCAHRYGMAERIMRSYLLPNVVDCLRICYPCR